MAQTKIEKLREKAAQIDAQIKDIEARQRSQTRKNDTRRKIIAGALALHHLDKNPDDTFSRKLLRLLDEYVTKTYERKLFDLPALPENLQNNAANDSGNQISDLRENFQAEK